MRLMKVIPQIPYKCTLALYVLHRKSDTEHKPHSMWSFLPPDQTSGGVKVWVVEVEAWQGSVDKFNAHDIRLR